MRQKSARKFYSSPNAKLKNLCQLKIAVSSFFIFSKIANQSTINTKCSRKYRFSTKIKRRIKNKFICPSKEVPVLLSHFDFGYY